MARKKKSKLQPLINAINDEIAEVKGLNPTQAQQNISQVLVKGVILGLGAYGIPAPPEATQETIVKVTSIVMCDLFEAITDKDKLFLNRIINEYHKQKLEQNEKGEN